MITWCSEEHKVCVLCTNNGETGQEHRDEQYTEKENERPVCTQTCQMAQ